jgi:hypothetical protein
MGINIVSIHRHNGNFNKLFNLRKIQDSNIFTSLYSSFSNDCNLNSFFEEDICIRSQKDGSIFDYNDSTFPSVDYYISTREGENIFIQKNYFIIIYPVRIHLIEMKPKYIELIKKTCTSFNKIFSINGFTILFDSNQLIFDKLLRVDDLNNSSIQFQNIKTIKDLNNIEEIDYDKDIFVGS